MARRSSLDGKVVISTGASSGIGRASALAFAREGATTVLASRSAEKLERVADEIRGFNPQVLVVPTDVSVPEQVQHLIDTTVKEFERIDILFNNAGNARRGRPGRHAASVPGQDPAHAGVRSGRHRESRVQTAPASRPARPAAHAAPRRCAVTPRWRPDRAPALKTPLLVPRRHVPR